MLIDDIRAEYARYRLLAERAIAQVSDEALNHVPAPDTNSMAMLMRHIAGNFVSRFTDFLTTDGEKPDRDRDREFDEGVYDRADVEAAWKKGWNVLDSELAALTDADLDRTVTIRGQPHTVHEALGRSVAHLAYHVGQMVLLARVHAGSDWKWLTIPKGQSQAYNRSPDRDKVPRAR